MGLEELLLQQLPMVDFGFGEGGALAVEGVEDEERAGCGDCL